MVSQAKFNYVITMLAMKKIPPPQFLSEPSLHRLSPPTLHHFPSPIIHFFLLTSPNCSRPAHAPHVAHSQNDSSGASITLPQRSVALSKHYGEPSTFTRVLSSERLPLSISLSSYFSHVNHLHAPLSDFLYVLSF